MHQWLRTFSGAMALHTLEFSIARSKPELHKLQGTEFAVLRTTQTLATYIQLILASTSFLACALWQLLALFSVPSLFQQPLDTLQCILHQFPTTFQVWEETPESMGQTGIHVQARLHAAIFAQDTLINEPFIPQRIHAANLKVGWREVLVTVGVEEGRVERRGLFGFI